MFNKNNLITALAEARLLENGAVDEARPYDQKYKAAEVLSSSSGRVLEVGEICCIESVSNIRPNSSSHSRHLKAFIQTKL